MTDPVALEKLIADAVEVARASVPAWPPMLLPGDWMRFIADARR